MRERTTIIMTSKHDDRRPAVSMQPPIPQVVQTNSLELRRLPVDLVLEPGRSSGADTCALSSEGDSQHFSLQPAQKGTNNLLRVLLRATCLNPKWSLRSQLMLSFGSISVLTITLVVVICIVSALRAGDNVKEINQESLQQLFARIQGALAPYLAEALTPRLTLSDVNQIMIEGTQDRFAGYPNPTDDFVPFLDMNSQTNMYPVRGKPLPMAWQFDTKNLLTEENSYEYVQNRWPLFAGESFNAEGWYFMRGSCDPSETNSSAYAYWPNCTDANNNVTTGGVDGPSPTNEMIYRKASDLTPLMKALFEYHEDLEDIYIYFANSGAGSFATYPHTPREVNTYVSIGCDWMSAPNPYNPAIPIGTPEMIGRCRPNGTIVSSRAYNPLERAWCIEAALFPNRTTIIGPFIGVGYNHLALALFRAVYDRVTNQFIGAIALTLSLTTVQDIVKSSSIPSIVEVSLVRWDTVGTLVASSRDNASVGSDVLSIAAIGVGVSAETYHEVWSMVNFDAVWDPLEVRNAYATYKAVHRDGFQVTAFPISPIPDSYDADYRPQFLVFLSVYENAIDERIQRVNNDVDSHEHRIVTSALVLGAAGIVLLLAIILAMSHMITWPLRTMNKAARGILSGFGQPDKADGEIEADNPQSAATNRSCCIPKTELSEVTEEFNKMVSRFSVSTMATSMRCRISDKPNKFALQDAFRGLYQSRQEKGFLYQTNTGGAECNTGFIHVGSNLVADDFTIHTRESLTNNPSNRNYRLGSSLFVWITILIVLPLILTTASISATGLYQISTELHGTVKYAEDAYIAVELSGLSFYAQARADYVSSSTATSLRDLHLLTRYASWLLFGGLNRTGAFVDMISGQEPCKAFLNVTDCGYYKDHSACDCAWNDVDARVQCERYETDSRYLQKISFGDQSLDTWPNGDRNSTGFPKDSYSPQTTAWWFNASTVPGSERGVLAAGYVTTYDRLRVSSAIPLFQVLHNYDKTKEYVYASYVSFEADGLILGYSGCGTVLDSLLQAQWLSSESNAAAKLRPELCPLGKYGYDPRCREWYDTGKKLAADNISAVYVTPPYLFASGSVFGLSATAPLIDPATKESVGQVLIDFRSDNLYAALQNRTLLAKGGFPILITVRPNNDGADTVIGPGFSQHEAAKSITSLVLPIDQSCITDQCKKNVLQFEDILASMRTGARNVSEYYRTSSDGSVEKAYIAYAPINAMVYQPVNSSDFLRGVEPSQFLVYSLGLVETEKGLLEPFVEVQNNTETQIHKVIIVMTVVIFVAILFLVYFSYVVTSALTEPMLILLQVIQGINQVDIDDDPLKLDWSVGSRELSLFLDTMDSLNRVMRAVRRAYFGGDLEKAYFVLDDTLTLFRRLGNEKAIGVACNNLGNVMLALYCRMQRTGVEGAGELSRLSIIRKGVTCYTAAIQLGEKGYEQIYTQEGWSPNCLDFMQHLSDRYSNRAMFLLTVSTGDDQAQEMQKLGLRDLQISRNMDVEIAVQGKEVEWGSVNRTETLFEVALVRASGHMRLHELGYPDDWDLEHVLNNTFLMLMTEMKQSSSSLFREIGPIGRLQQLETVLTKYHCRHGSLETAAQIAIRSLVEDDYIFPDAEYQAVRALLVYVNSRGGSRSVKDRLKYYMRCCYMDMQYESSIAASLAEDEKEVPERSFPSAVAASIELEHIEEYVRMEGF